MASCIRRKPLVTYKSPSADDHAFFTPSSTRSSSKKFPSSTSQSESLPSCSTTNTQNRDLQRSCHSYLKSASLPLFHPLGRLAMSLPPLDPIRFGLPIPATLDELDSKSSSRVRRPVAIHEADEDIVVSSSPTVSSIAAVAAREMKERPSPRKRRAGGAKRKRKDADDGDATYPAKKTRTPRGLGPGAEEEPLADGELATIETEAVAEGLPDPTDAPKRRTTRTKGSLKRRDSSASETTSVAGSSKVNPGHTQVGEITASNIEEAENPSNSHGTDLLIKNDTKDEKEEGELSEGLPNS